MSSRISPPQRPDNPNAHVHKHTRTGQGEHQATNNASTDRRTARTPSPGAGTKRSSNDVQATDDNQPQPAPDTKALYDANKEEIEQWYEEDFSHKQGIPLGGKLLRSNHKWYVKVNAWMKMKRLVQSPKKKRKLNDGTPISAPPHNCELKPDQIKYPGDVAPVPEYPHDKIADYTPAPNGRYACSHVHLNPPKERCRAGLMRAGKLSAIKKDVVRWKGRVEKLIDKGELDKRHMTWPDWTVRELREKYQPELWAQQEAKREGERERKEKDKERERISMAHMDREDERRHGPRSVDQRPAAARPAPVPDHPQRYVPQMVFVRPTPAATPAPQPPSRSSAQHPATLLNRRGESNTIASAQTAFLVDLARANPRLLRSYERLYRDAQYREILKENPDFEMLRDWYLAYFLRQQRRQLTAEQSALLENGDPSQNGKRRLTNVQVLRNVDQLFGDYRRAARAEREMQRSQQQLVQSAGLVEELVQPSRYVSSQAVGRVAQTTGATYNSSVQDETYDFDELFGEVEPMRATAPPEQPVSQMPFKILSPEELDNELNRILGLDHQPTAEATESTGRNNTILRSETSYVSTLPLVFATGNQSVDDEMQKMLEYAYQTGPASGVAALEDEQLLRQTSEKSRSDWQRYCESIDNEQLLPEEAVPIQQQLANEFDVGEPFTEEQLAMFADFDDLGDDLSLFTKYDARIAAAHTANLAQHREMSGIDKTLFESERL